MFCKHLKHGWFFNTRNGNNTIYKLQCSGVSHVGIPVLFFWLFWGPFVFHQPGKKEGFRLAGWLGFDAHLRLA